MCLFNFVFELLHHFIDLCVSVRYGFLFFDKSWVFFIDFSREQKLFLELSFFKYKNCMLPVWTLQYIKVFDSKPY